MDRDDGQRDARVLSWYDDHVDGEPIGILEDGELNSYSPTMWADKAFIRAMNTPLVLDPDDDGDVPAEGSELV
jgi:hypothetical protein